MSSPIEIERTFRTVVSRPSASSAMRSFNDLPVSVLSFEGSALVDANDEWAAISGLDVFDSAGDGWLRVIHPDDRMDLSAYVNHTTIEARTPVSVRVRADGRHAEWFSAHARTFRTNDVAKVLLTLTAAGARRGDDSHLGNTAAHDGPTGVLRTSSEVDVATAGEALVLDPRPDQLHAAHEGTIAVAQATGMIVQRSGADAVESAALLLEYATAHNISFVIAAKMLVERTIGIDTVAIRSGDTNDHEQWSRGMPDPGSEQIASTERLGSLRDVYGEHSAAVFGCASFICGAEAARVTERVFVTFWEQRGSKESNAASVRIQLLTLTHRLAMHAALSVTRMRAERSPGGAASPSDAVTAVLSRGQAIERTLGCASLTPTERSFSALVIYGRCTYHEIAKFLDAPDDDVSQQLRTGLRRVRTELAER